MICRNAPSSTGPLPVSPPDLPIGAQAAGLGWRGGGQAGGPGGAPRAPEPREPGRGRDREGPRSTVPHSCGAARWPQTPAEGGVRPRGAAVCSPAFWRWVTFRSAGDAPTRPRGLRPGSQLPATAPPEHPLPRAGGRLPPSGQSVRRRNRLSLKYSGRKKHQGPPRTGSCVPEHPAGGNAI